MKCRFCGENISFFCRLYTYIPKKVRICGFCNIFYEKLWLENRDKEAIKMFQARKQELITAKEFAKYRIFKLIQWHNKERKKIEKLQKEAKKIIKKIKLKVKK